MARVAVRCLWRFFDDGSFYDATDLALWLECDVWVDWLHLGSECDPDGYLLVAVFIAANDEKFLMTYGSTLNLYGYVECVDCDVVDASLVNTLDLEPLPSIMDGSSDLNDEEFDYIARRNCQIRDDEILWIYAKYEKQPLTPSSIECFKQLAEDERVIVFYNHESPGFYLKLHKFPGFHIWLDELKATLTLKSWRVIPTLWEQPPPIIKRFLRLAPETLLTFLQSIGYQS